MSETPYGSRISKVRRIGIVYAFLFPIVLELFNCSREFYLLYLTFAALWLCILEACDTVVKTIDESIHAKA